jgi:conjugal transfer pilus assembly protein TrbC
LEALARGFAADGRPPSASNSGEAQLLVFVSLSMPKATLERLVDQAARVPARIVLRGMSEGSLVRTAARVQRLIGQRPVAIQIDPLEFDRYAVRQVPTFVLARSADAGGCASAQCAVQGYAVVAGDVSLAYALRQIRDRAPGLRQDASRLLARLQP